jgi:hypothetical protein
MHALKGCVPPAGQHRIGDLTVTCQPGNLHDSSKAGSMLTRISLRGDVPNLGPRPLGGPVSDAYALRFLAAGLSAVLRGCLTLGELLMAA